MASFSYIYILNVRGVISPLTILSLSLSCWLGTQQRRRQKKTHFFFFFFDGGVAQKHRADKHKVPETKNIEEGSARRNIARKHDHDPNK